MNTQKVQISQCDMKTDLNLLLECLKYQMDCPLSQKEALITIYSICQQNSEASEYLREIGGLMFINDLAKSSAHCIVKEAALFTLGIIIESNVYCQQTLCTSALFEDLILFLIKKDSGVNLKRMSVYVILALVSNNKNGQTCVRDTGCISLLLQLFRTTLSTSEKNVSDENSDPCYQLWCSVCSTLCACVNNPQNEDNQNICCSVFPHAKEWLESCTEPEIVRPICSFLGLTVANNSYVQKYFASIGGLDTLAKVLLELMHDSCLSHSSMKLAVVVTKTLDACIANNSAMGVVLAKYHTVSELLKLLSNETLSTGEKISIILTIGHCTEVCEENQCELLQNNGLPLMIQVLTESQDEELIKAATFVLQNCKQMTEQLSLKLYDNSLNVNNAEELDVQVRNRCLQDYWKKAKEILHRINSIEKQHNEERVQGEIFVDESSVANSEALKSHEVKPVDPKKHAEGTQKVVCCPQLTSKLNNQVLAPSLTSAPQKNETVNTMDAASTRQTEQRNIPCSVTELQTDSVPQSHNLNGKTACGKSRSGLQAGEQLFKQPAETVKNMKQTCTSDLPRRCRHRGCTGGGAAGWGPWLWRGTRAGTEDQRRYLSKRQGRYPGYRRRLRSGAGCGRRFRSGSRAVPESCRVREEVSERCRVREAVPERFPSGAGCGRRFPSGSGAVLGAGGGFRATPGAGGGSGAVPERCRVREAVPERFPSGAERCRVREAVPERFPSGAERCRGSGGGSGAVPERCRVREAVPERFPSGAGCGRRFPSGSRAVPGAGGGSRAVPERCRVREAVPERCPSGAGRGRWRSQDGARRAGRGRGCPGTA
ncbi:telomere repeats-binding bouquet formation protein 1 [Ammospiza maritima maritima]